MPIMRNGGGGASAPVAAVSGVSGSAVASAGKSAYRFVPLAAADAGLARTLPPASANWTQIGSPTVEDLADGSIRLSALSNGDQNTPAISGLYRAKPGTNWRITVCMKLSMLWEAYFGGGVFFYESSSGKIVNFGVGGNGSISTIGVDNFNSRTSWNATVTSKRWFSGSSELWLRITDDGTNRICSASPDGGAFHTISTVARTNFITADKFGFQINPQSNEASPAGIVGTLAYLKEEVL